MRTCEACGFENAEPGTNCPLCGASEIRRTPTLSGDLPTVEYPGGRPPIPVSATIPPQGLGRVYAGRYRVDALLGSGGMGRVFRAHDLREDVDRALKVLLPLTEDDPGRADRFRREIDVLSRIQHPAVLHILDWGSSEGELFLVTELIDGPDLKSEIRRRGPWPVAEATSLAATVADALAAAHAAGVVHRDVKPNNIMIAAGGTARLLDFGLARGRGIDMATITRTGTIVGTPGYMSPEQFEGHGGEPSDVYSLGVVLFELLTARLPFTGQTPLAVALKHRTEPAPAPRTLRPDLPAWLERVVLQCLEKDPAQRFASAASLSAELRKERGGPQRHRLPSGDVIVEDVGETTDWALVLRSHREKTGWSPGMTLRVSDRYYRLGEVQPPSTSHEGWTYRFGFWPASEVFRRLVDYEQDCADRAALPEERLGSRLRRWLKGDGS